MLTGCLCLKCSSQNIYDNMTMKNDVVALAVRVTHLKPGLVETHFSNVRFHGDNQRASGSVIHREAE